MKHQLYYELKKLALLLILMIITFTLVEIMIYLPQLIITWGY